MIKEVEEESSQIKAVKIVGLVLLVAVVAATLFGCLVNVPAGNVGILFDRVSGGVQMQPLSEGWHVAIPFTQTIYLMDVRTTKTEYPASAASKDLQIVNSVVAVSYHVIPGDAPNVYKSIGGDFSDKMIAPAIQEQFKASTAQFDAQDLIQQRDVVKAEVSNKLQNLLTKYGIKIDEVSLMNFQFSSDFEKAIEEKVVAQQNKLTAENVLAIKQVEAQQAIAEATGIANSTLVQAQADAAAVRVKGEAAAYSTQVQGEAQAKALSAQKEEVSELLVKLRTIQQWNGQLPNVMMGNGANPLAVLGINATN